MSAPSSEKTTEEKPTAEKASTRAPSPALTQDTTGSPKNFGLNVRRLRRARIIVFAVLALPILALALLAVKFLSMPITQATHQSAYEAQDYPTAIERLAPVEFTNWFEPYLPHLSKGTDLLQQDKDAEAEKELRTAMTEWTDHSDLNSPAHAQCKIANNLALSIERQADQIEDPQERADRLFEAEEILAPCAAGGGGGEGEGGQGGGTGNEDSGTTEDNGDRVKEKRREADEEAGNDPDDRGEPGSGSPQDPGEPTKEDPEGDGPDEEAPTEGDSEQKSKEDKLKERNKESQGGEGETDPGGSEQDPNKPW
ncbi:hypothetical protein [Brachybacterium tyrofermentans]|uniref:hypothetical protein n=1 Tax=Brachybacterium tyrofermentans TaxID=47848 RepID=UPI003FB6B0F1